MADPKTSTPAPAPPPTSGPATAAPTSPPAAPAAAGGWLINGLIAVTFMLFAFSAYWLFLGYRAREAEAARLVQAQAQAAANQQAVIGDAIGPVQLQAAADTALTFLKQRPEFAQEIGALLDPAQPVEYRMTRTAELGVEDDLKFRMTLRGAKSHAWYDTILRSVNGRWELQMAALTVPDQGQARVIHLLDPAPQTPPPE